jgi:anthranilate phosphoribosyltransferase
MFAPAHHAAARYASAPRRELGTRTLFNLLGPLTNPALAPNQLLGVFSARWVEPMAQVLQALGSSHVLVVHSEDGLDEISLAAPTRVTELKAGGIRSYTLKPEDVGVERRPLKELQVDGPEASLRLIKEALEGKPGAAFDMVVLNAGAALYAADVAESLAAGVTQARTAIAGGGAWRKVDELVDATR